jgi:hypothetical protein
MQLMSDVTMFTAKVYGIVSETEPDHYLYIGSTCQTLAIRWNDHKGESKRCPDRKVYVFLLEHGFKNFRIVEIEEGEFANKDDLRIHEEHFRLLYEPPLNTRRSSIGDMSRSDYVKEFLKAYYKKNKEQLLKKRKTQVTCECGCSVSSRNISRHRNTLKHINRMRTGNKEAAAFILDQVIKSVAKLLMS